MEIKYGYTEEGYFWQEPSDRLEQLAFTFHHFHTRLQLSMSNTCCKHRIVTERMRFEHDKAEVMA